MNENTSENILIEEKPANPVRHIKLLDVEETAIKYAIDDYNGNVSEYIRDLVRKDDKIRQKNFRQERKTQKMGILQIIAYMFISTDLLVIALFYFQSSLLVMAITIASGGLLLFYSGVTIATKIRGALWT